MSRDFKCNFDDDFIADFFNKRREMNRIKNEVESTSKKIKDDLLSNGMFYAATKNYTLNICQNNQANDKFILLLKKNNLGNYIQEYCSVSIVDEISAKLGLDPNDYKELRYHVLKVGKKK